MTPEQAKVFVGVAQAGIACGLQHRYEWFYNGLRMLSHGLYTEINERTAQIVDAFLAFEKGTASCPEEDEELAKLDYDGYIVLTNKFYNGQKDKSNG